MYAPSYTELAWTGELGKRAERLSGMLEACTLCPHECRINRSAGETGNCEAPGELIVSSCFPHFGEEPELSGWNGSGTVFLAYCSLKCCFCQNDDLSHAGSGRRMEIPELAGEMLKLQRSGCHNINFVTPTHYVPHIVSALAAAAEQGLSVPIVYNTSGYESLETLRLLDGIVDIYMPDVKFTDNETGSRYTLADGYTDALFDALKEMHRQVGDLQTDGTGIAQRGILIRHLVMPNGVAGTPRIMKFISEELGADTYVNVMDQYRPHCRAYRFPEINRRITRNEWEDAAGVARMAGLYRGF